MPNPVLVGYDPDTLDRGPVELGAAVSRATGAAVVVCAVDPGSSAEARQALDHAQSALRSAGRSVEVQLVRDTRAADGLARAIEDVGPSLVVVGSTRRGAAGRVLLGSTAERVVHDAPCPVAVTPHEYAPPAGGVRTIGAAFAPTPEGREALRAAVLLGRAADAHVRAIAVFEPKLAEHQSPDLMAGQHHDTAPEELAAGRHRIESEEGLRAAIAQAAPDGDVEADVLFQDPADGLVAASGGLDLLVMGSRGYGAKRGVVLGGVSRQVTARAACPVLVLARGTEGGVDRLLGQAAATS